MRANGKSSYQIKKEKLQRIKRYIIAAKMLPKATYTTEEIFNFIWEIVKDE